MREYEPILEIIEEHYEIPHLNTYRKISALLPHDYHETDKRYPVVYLQDGQNLFNPHAPFGDWAIDKSLGKLATKGKKDLIIVAIDHGEEERIKEYLPYSHPEFGEGEGKYYVQFLEEKLIPYVNRKYRTLTGPKYTGIGGSSMGALISLYAGFTQPSIFGKLMIFSPSLWISDMTFQHAEMYQPAPHSRMYLYGGGKESQAHLPNLMRLSTFLGKKNHDFPDFAFRLSINDDGTHSEEHWRNEFPKAIKWLFFQKEDDLQND